MNDRKIKKSLNLNKNKYRFKMYNPVLKEWTIEFYDEYNKDCFVRNSYKQQFRNDNFELISYELIPIPYRFYFVRKIGWKIKNYLLGLFGKILFTINDKIIAAKKPLKKITISEWLMIIVGISSIIIMIILNK